jgi:F-type H+-transporting ATPase subunit epsilon
MRLRIVTPSAIRLDVAARRVVAEGPDGAFGMLPRHIDFVSRLVPGVLVYETAEGAERYAGVGAGTLVKCAEEVLVSVRRAALGEDLAALRAHVETEFRAAREAERAERAALARLEIEMLRRFREMGEAG